MNLQELIVEQSLLIDKQNDRLNEANGKFKKLLEMGIYCHADVENIITAVLVRIREKAESEVEAICYIPDEQLSKKIKNEVLNAIWFSVSAVKYKDLLNIDDRHENRI